MKRECKTCEWWDSERRQLRREGFGSCHRFPPTLEHAILTNDVFWCGEYKEKVVEEKKPAGRPIFEADLGARAMKALKAMKIKTAEQLLEHHANIDWKQIKGCGPSTVREIEEFINANL